MCPDAQLGKSVLREGWGAELIRLLSDVHQFVLDERAPLQVAAFERVVRIERDQERRHAAEPLNELLLLPGTLPTASADHHLFALADDAAHLPDVLDDRP